MIYRVAGMLFFLFGCFSILGHLFGGGGSPRAGGGGVASEYNDLITGTAFFAVGLLVLFKSSGKKA